MRTLFKVAPILCLLLTAGIGDGCEKQIAPPGVNLPYAPQHYVDCFNKLTPIPIKTLDKQMVVKLIADLRRSELAQSQCGKDLLAWYDKVRVAYAPKKKR